MATATMTYAELKALLDTLTPEQLAQPVVWSGDSRGGHVKRAWIAEEDWIGDPNDGETWMPRSQAETEFDPEDYAEAGIGIAKATVHLMVD